MDSDEMTMPTFQFERELAQQYGPCVAGIDEVGRGPWAGPVVAASAVILDQARFLIDFSEVNDSKQLSKTKRERLYEALTRAPYIRFGIGQASVQEIDAINILQATFLAMKRSLENLHADACLVDGNRIPPLSIPTQAIIKGDHLSYSIATASIIAKVFRDHMMQELAKDFPEYGWQKNAGYGTAHHIAAIQKFGITQHHRHSYAPIKKQLAADQIISANTPARR